MPRGEKEGREKKVEKKNRLQEWFINEWNFRILSMLLIIVIYIGLRDFAGDDEVIIIGSGFRLPAYIICDILLTLDITLFIEFLMNRNYKKHFRQSIYEIITDVNLMKEFIDQERKKDIMYVALHANLGDHITEALYNNILDNYLDTYNNLILRENSNFTIYLETGSVPGFYSADIQITFQIPPRPEDVELRIFACQTHDEAQKKMQGIIGLNKQLVFPMVLADDSDKIQDDSKVFATEIYVNNAQVKELDIDDRREKMLRIDGDDKPVYIRIQIQTLLNRRENFFQDDIFCIHKGYSLTLSYESGLLGECKCYHSCKSKGLVTIQNNNHIKIQTSGILLPENNFVFIWETPNP